MARVAPWAAGQRQSRGAPGLMAALILLVLLLATVCAALLQPLIHLGDTVLAATWLIWLPLAAAMWVLLADDQEGGGKA